MSGDGEIAFMSKVLLMAKCHFLNISMFGKSFSVPAIVIQVNKIDMQSIRDVHIFNKQHTKLQKFADNVTEN